MNVWLIIFIIFFLILALKRLDWAVLLFIMSLTTYLIRFKIIGIPLTLLEVMIFLTFGVWFFKFFVPKLTDIIKNREKCSRYPYSWEIILLMILSLAAAGISGFDAGALGIWKAYFFEPILFFLLILNVFKERKDFIKIFWALAISAAAVSIFAIFQKITGLFISNPTWAAAATRRAVSFFGYPNAIGLYLAPLVLLFTGWLFSLPWKNVFEQMFKKLIIILTIIISLLAIYAARSEGALIGIAVALILFGLLSGKKQRVATLFLLITVIGGVFWFAPSRDFIPTKMSLHDLSGQIRLQQWKETLKMLEAGKIISGAGLNNYQTAVKPYHQEGIFFNSDNLPQFDSVVWASSTLRTKYWQPVEIYLYPHNIILNFWSELGILGLLLFTWLIAKYLFTAIKLSINLGRNNNPDKYLVLGLATAMITIVIHGLVDVPYFKNDLAVMFWLFFALLSLLNFNYRQELKYKLT